MKLEWIEIYGFRKENIKAKIKLSPNQFSFMYGQNGIGKTTLLELIYAIFDKKEKKMITENVDMVKIGVKDEDNLKEIVINSYYEDNEKYYDWTDFDRNGLNEFNVLYITTQRALNEYRENITVNMLAYYLENNKDVTIDYLSSYFDLSNLCNFINGRHDEEIIKDVEKDNVCINSLRISDIGKLIIHNYFKILTEAREVKANIVSNILTICFDYLTVRDKELKTEHKTFEYDYKLSKDEEKILKELMDDNVEIIRRVLKSEVEYSPVEYSVTEKVQLELSNYKKHMRTLKSLEIFNEITGKNVIIVDNNVNVIYNYESHDLTKLSHGERHLLTLLTLVDFIGKNKNIILIDEPCIALDTDWQERLAEVFSKITNSPFLIATHSPYISQNHLDDQIDILGGLSNGEKSLFTNRDSKL